MKPLIIALTLTLGGCYVIIGGQPPSASQLSDAIKVCRATTFPIEAVRDAMTNIMVFSTL